MTRILTALILAAALPLSAQAGSSINKFSNDDARYLAETGGVNQRQTVAKNSYKSVIRIRSNSKVRGQHSLRDPYGDPALIYRDLFR